MPRRDRRWADAIQRRPERYTLGSVLAVFAAESRPSGADAGLDAHHAQDPAPLGESLNDGGLFVGFAWHWF